MILKNFALIGCGYWGTIIANNLKKMKVTNHIYIYDSKKNRVNIFKKKFKNFVKYKNIKFILKQNDITHIYLATPPSQNFKLIKFFLKSKKKIFVEKPGLKKISELKKLKKIANSKNLFFGYVYLFNKYIHFLKKIINNQEFGEIKYICFNRKNFGPIRQDVNSFLDLGTHDVAIAKYLLNKPIKLINYNKHNVLRYNSGDIISASFKSKKTVIDINVSWLNPEKIRKILILTTKKMILFNELNQKNPIQIFNNYAKYPKLNFFSKKYFNKKKKFNMNKPLFYKGNIKNIKFKKIDPLREELTSFIKNKKYISNINFAEEVLNVSKNLD